MGTLAELLKEHYDNHPGMEVRDAVKFLYQSHMGPGHLVDDEGAALARLKAEWDQVEADPALPLAEPLGNGLFRLNLVACKAKSLSPYTLNRLFVLTARETFPDRSGLESGLDLVYTLPFPRDAADAFLAQYRSQGCPAVSHSEAYRRAFRPAYRVVSESYVNLIPILSAIDRGMAEQPRLRVAIDGPCASGKSTLGAALAKIYRCPLVHMDDFFLRPEQRTQERLAQPGGNVDYERFDREVLSPLCRGEMARYRPWQCRAGSFGPEIGLEPAPLTVVEGSSALRPDLRDRYHLRIWVEAPWEVRLQRLAQRGGPGCLARFEQQWIPMEDRYFRACRVKECCQLIYP